MRLALLVATLVTLLAATQPASSTAALNSCNQYGECRARLVSVYTAGDNAFVVLQGHLIPSVCTSAPWGYYWMVPLSTDAGRARYATLLAAYMVQEVVEIRATDAGCTVMASNVGE